MLKRATWLGKLTVGVNTDRFVASYKAEPEQGQDQRVAALQSLGYVTVLNDGPGTDLIFDLRPRTLAIGPDWFDRDYLGQIGMTADELFGLDVVLAFVPPPRVPGLSSTALRKAKAAA